MAFEELSIANQQVHERPRPHIERLVALIVELDRTGREITAENTAGMAELALRMSPEDEVEAHRRAGEILVNERERSN